jgi:hypothetical protein
VEAEGRAVHAGGRPRAAAAEQGEVPDPRELIVRRSKREGAQIVRVGEGRWSPSAEDKFLAHLIVGYGVGYSARKVGFSSVAVYNRRTRDAAFAARWNAAREEGKIRNDGLLIDSVPRALDPEVMAAAEGLPSPTIDQAIRIMQLYRREDSGGAGGGRQRHMPPEPSIEQVRDEVLRRLKAIRAHRAKYGGGPAGEREG